MENMTTTVVALGGMNLPVCVEAEPFVLRRLQIVRQISRIRESSFQRCLRVFVLGVRIVREMWCWACLTVGSASRRRLPFQFRLRIIA